jgi:hypothetical protein
MNAAGEGSADDDISTHASHFSKTGSTRGIHALPRKQHSWSGEGALFPAVSLAVNGLSYAGRPKYGRRLGRASIQRPARALTNDAEVGRRKWGRWRRAALSDRDRAARNRQRTRTGGR